MERSDRRMPQRNLSRSCSTQNSERAFSSTFRQAGRAEARALDISRASRPCGKRCVQRTSGLPPGKSVWGAGARNHPMRVEGLSKQGRFPHQRMRLTKSASARIDRSVRDQRENVLGRSEPQEAGGTMRVVEYEPARRGVKPADAFEGRLELAPGHRLDAGYGQDVIAHVIGGAEKPPTRRGGSTRSRGPTGYPSPTLPITRRSVLSAIGRTLLAPSLSIASR